MSLGATALILVGGLFLLLALGAEIFVAIGTMAAIALVVFMGQGLDQFAYTSWSELASFSLTATPLFIFMGAMFASSGVVRTLFRGSDKLLSFLPGGMAASSIIASAVFGAISGSSIASVAAFGNSILPEMVRLGYKPKLSVGAICMGGTLSVLIPPSVILIIYGAYQQVSVPRLFAGGLVPGLILALCYLVTIFILVWRDPSLVPSRPPMTLSDKLSGFKDVLPAASIIGIILGFIFGGVMTPTEAAAVGAILSMGLAAMYKTLNRKTLKEAALQAVKVTAMIMPLIVVVKVFGYAFKFLGATDVLSDLLLGLPFGKFGIMAVIFLIYIILGTFMEGISIMLLSLAFVAPVIANLGFSFIWFGVIIVIVNELGLVTPPFGLNLFALRGVAPQYSLFFIAGSCVPFYPAVLITLGLCTVFPQLVTWLPELLF
ncbi:MAG: TRAP transporter large permease subunit [Dehalococcoidia bacterium]|jgi:tripartite ATP-independent transporter DctM subunit|nr:TRAP transporter large permease subunit [Dehalococcoidia bacterium]